MASMTKLMTAVLAFVVLVAATIGADAQNAAQFPSSINPQVQVPVQQFLNPFNQAVPESAANPSPVTCISGCSSPVVAPASTTMQSAAVANGNGTPMSVAGYATAIIRVNCSVACSGGTTINFLAADSTGAYVAIQGIPIAGGTGVTSTTTSGVWAFNVAGLTSMEAQIASYSAGTITVTGNVVTLGGGVGSGGGSSGGTSALDQSVFTQGTTPITPIGCLYIASYSNITTGHVGVLSCTAAGSLHTTVDNVNTNGPAAASAASPVTPSNQPVGAAAFAATQVALSSTATSIVAARTGVAGTGRVSVTITNTTTTAIYLGGSGVTTSTGTLLPGIVGASVTLNTTAAVYGIVATGTPTVTALETY
jgi:hypothetical protein